MTRGPLVALALVVATPAFAQDEPRFCPDRPSLDSTPCTVEAGRVLAEVSLLDWQRDDRADSRADRILVGDLSTRIGVASNAELRVGWTVFGHDRERDKVAGGTDTTNGVGDVTLGVRQSLSGNRTGLQIAVQPFVTLPTGRYPVGAGTWSTGALIPVQYDLAKAVNLQFTGEIDAAANRSGRGRHLAYSAVAGIGYKLTDAVTVNAELSVERDRDPSGHETHALAALSAAWQPSKRTQLDILAAAGLNHTSPDVQLVIGGAVLF